MEIVRCEYVLLMFLMKHPKITIGMKYDEKKKVYEVWMNETNGLIFWKTKFEFSEEEYRSSPTALADRLYRAYTDR